MERAGTQWGMQETKAVGELFMVFTEATQQGQ